MIDDEILNESARLKDRYNAAVIDAEESQAFYRTLASGKPVVLSEELILEADRRGSPNAAWRRAFAKLDEWRALRAASGMP